MVDSRARKGACLTCSGPCDSRAVRCWQCTRKAKGTCLTCAGPCDIRALRCRQCTRHAAELVCPRCRQRLPRHLFLTPAGNRQSYCPPCTVAWHRNNRYLTKYGITADEYDALLASQGGKCGICGSAEEGRGYKWLHVDHCHDTGAVRGILCSTCNTGIGHLGDSPERLRQALKYLESYTP